MITTLDCTLRDGGYINNWRFNLNFLNNYIETMNKINIDYVEIGFINKTSNYKTELVGDLRNLDEEQIKLFQNKNFKTVVMADYNDIDLKLLIKKIKIDLVRIAFHKNDLIDALNVCKKVKDLGYQVSVNAMAITNYAEDELDYLFQFINQNNLDILYVADSYGSLNQKNIKYYYELFQSKLENASIGFHLHNNMNNAYSNYEYLTNLDIKPKNPIFIDSTIFGMGRGAGNLQTELVFIHLNKNINLSIFIDLLYFIQEFIKPIFKVEENNWGYDLDYLLSGYLKMHPNYIVKMRDLNISMKNRLYLIEKINKDYNYKLFDINIINNLIKEFKNNLL
jgi:4-hydroxy 2-oxovalerate aldolase